MRRQSATGSDWEKHHELAVIIDGLNGWAPAGFSGPRLVYGSRAGLPDGLGEPGKQDWRTTEKAAREVAETVAKYLWHREGHDR